MKVILIADVKNVGKKGEVVDVSEGYATNFLIKKRLAILQNKANLNDLNKQKEEEKSRNKIILSRHGIPWRLFHHKKRRFFWVTKIKPPSLFLF